MLRHLVKKRLVEDMLGSFSKDDDTWKILIVDSDALKIISVACKLSDLMQNNVTVVEVLKNERQPFPQMAAVYFIAPSTSSVDRMLDDWRTRQRYKEAYVFFTARVPESTMKLISQSKMVRYIKGFTELNMDFWAVESNAFTFGMNSDISILWRPTSTKTEQFCQLVGQKLATVFSTLGEIPLIRYQENESKLTEMTAQALQKYVYELAKKSSGRLQQKNKTICLIVDRTVDSLAPLLHEFTYQAMVYDLMNVDVEGIYTHEYKSGSSGEMKKRDVQLQEDDSIWKKYRHMFRILASNGLAEEYKKFKEDYKDMKTTREDGQQKSTKEMSKIMHKLSDFMKKDEEFKLHLSILQSKLLTVAKEEKLEKLGELEQDMAVGEDIEGKQVNAKILGNFGPLLQFINTESKIRLMLIYFLTQKVKEQDREKKMKSFGFDMGSDFTSWKDPRVYLDNIQKMGIELKTKKGLFNLKDKFTKKKSQIEDGTFALTRYVPEVKNIAKQCINGSLSEKDYPYLSKPAGSISKLASSTPTPSTPTSKAPLRKKPQWAQKSKKKLQTEVQEKEVVSKKGAYQLIIFVLGGATYSETRAVYELENEYKMNVYMGGTSLITPKQFLKQLETL